MESFNEKIETAGRAKPLAFGDQMEGWFQAIVMAPFVAVVAHQNGVWPVGFAAHFTVDVIVVCLRRLLPFGRCPGHPRLIFRIL